MRKQTEDKMGMFTIWIRDTRSKECIYRWEDDFEEISYDKSDAAMRDKSDS